MAARAQVQQADRPLGRRRARRPAEAGQAGIPGADIQPPAGIGLAGRARRAGAAESRMDREEGRNPRAGLLGRRSLGRKEVAGTGREVGRGGHVQGTADTGRETPGTEAVEMARDMRLRFLGGRDFHRRGRRRELGWDGLDGHP